MNRSLPAALLVFLPAIGAAQDTADYRCTLGDMVRRVEIFYEPGRAVPCEVHYYKDTEAPGERQVLWRALNEAGFCEARVAEFVQKLETSGWDCAKAPPGAAPEAAEPEEDDTAELSPAEETA